MADFVSELATRCNINVDMAKKGLGAILAFMKAKLPTDVFSKVTAAVPESENAISAFQSATEAAGGVLDAVKKLFGGADVLAKLAKLGFSTEQITSFIPKVLEFLKGKLPADAMNQVAHLLPVPETAGV